MLTFTEIRNLPFQNISITDYAIIGNQLIVEISGIFYHAEGQNLFPTGRFREVIRVYVKNNLRILFDLETGIFAHLRTANIIKSQVNVFNGFAYGNEFTLTNGQVWAQTSTLNSPCNPGGKVWIKDNSIMRVGNWNFDVAVQRIR